MRLSLAPGLTLYFCRHGETEGNRTGHVQGQSKDTPLTAQGEGQARRVGDILKHHVGAPAQLLYVSSPIGRARMTMEIIRTSLGLPRDGYSTDPRLMELSYGIWEGLTRAEAHARDPALYDARQADKWNVAAPGGETYADVARRAQNWLGDVRADTFAVSHGVFTRILRGLLQGLTWQEMMALDEPQGVLFRVRESNVERFED